MVLGDWKETCIFKKEEEKRPCGKHKAVNENFYWKLKVNDHTKFLSDWGQMLLQQRINQ